MTFSEQEKQIILYGKQNNKTRQEIEQAIIRSRTNNPAVRQASDVPTEQSGGIIQKVKDIVSTQGMALNKDIQQIAGQDARLGISDIMPVAASVMGKTGKAVGSIVGAGVESGIKSILTDNQKEAIKMQVEKAIESTTGKKVVGAFGNLATKYDEWKSSHPTEARNLENSIGIVDLATTIAGFSGARQVGSKAVSTVGEGISTAENTARQVARDIVKPVAEAANPTIQSIKQIPGKIATNLADKAATEKAIVSLPTEMARTAARNGIALKDVKIVGQIGAVDDVKKGLARQLATAVQKVSRGEQSVDPIEVIGRPVTDAISTAQKHASSIGKKLESAANKLGRVSSAELQPEVLSQLQGVRGLEGLKINKSGLLDFKNTTLATVESKSDRNAIQSIYNQAISSGTGRQKHLLRQELYSVLESQKRAGVQLTDTQDKAFDAIRKALSNVLNTKNASYKTLNEQYATVATPIDQLKKKLKLLNVIGADEDLKNMSAGILARRITSTAPSNPEIVSILRSLDKAAGTTSAETTKFMQDFYNVLNKYYEVSPATGFQGQIKSSLEGGSGFVSRAVNAIAGNASETPAVRRKVLEDLLAEVLK